MFHSGKDFNTKTLNTFSNVSFWKRFNIKTLNTFSKKLCAWFKAMPITY